MKLANEELDAILAKAGLELAQPYSENNKYRKDGYLFTRCLTCGTEAHYRLKYILDKNGVGERTCRACYWMGWYGCSGVARSAACECKFSGTPIQSSIMRAEKLAEEHGFDLINLLQGDRDGADVLVVRCKACGRQTAERPEDVSFGCTCGGKARGIAYGAEAVAVPREDTPVASGLYQDGTIRLLVDSGSQCLEWWDTDINGEVPSNLTCLSREEYAWKCPRCGHRFKAPVYAMRTPWCPSCTALRLVVSDIKWDILSRMTAADFPALLAVWNDKEDPSAVSVTSGKLIHLECPKGHHPAQTLYSYLKDGCMVCRGLRQRPFPIKAIWYRLIRNWQPSGFGAKAAAITLRRMSRMAANEQLCGAASHAVMNGRRPLGSGSSGRIIAVPRVVRLWARSPGNTRSSLPNGVRLTQ